MTNIRVATICHNEDNYKQRGHRRVRLVLKMVGTEYWWYQSDDGDLTYTGVNSLTIYDAEIDAMRLWGDDEWDFRAKWLNH